MISRIVFLVTSEYQIVKLIVIIVDTHKKGKGRSLF